MLLVKSSLVFSLSSVRFRVHPDFQRAFMPYFNALITETTTTTAFGGGACVSVAMR
jgi:hypothetical protein